MDEPGLFFFLVRDAVISPADVEPLIALLPPESFVVSSQRGGEAFDSKRWPLARDAALASLCAARFADAALREAQSAIDRAEGDPLQLRALLRRSNAGMLGAPGADPELFTKLWRDATPGDLEVFTAPPPRSPAAALINDLYGAHYNAADGLYAHHVHRGSPGPSAEPAARIARAAIEEGAIGVAHLVEAAISLVRAEPSWRRGAPSEAPSAATTFDVAARAACTDWLEQKLYPLAVKASGLSPTTSPRDVLDHPHRFTPCYEEAADYACEGLVIVAASRAVAYWSQSAEARVIRDAILHLAMHAGHERAAARDLLADMAPFAVPDDFAERADDAEEAFERWIALEDAVTSAACGLLFEIAGRVRYSEDSSISDGT